MHACSRLEAALLVISFDSFTNPVERRFLWWFRGSFDNNFHLDEHKYRQSSLMKHQTASLGGTTSHTHSHSPMGKETLHTCPVLKLSAAPIRAVPDGELGLGLDWQSVRSWAFVRVRLRRAWFDRDFAASGCFVAEAEVRITAWRISDARESTKLHDISQRLNYRSNCTLYTLYNK